MTTTLKMALVLFIASSFSHVPSPYCIIYAFQVLTNKITIYSNSCVHSSHFVLFFFDTNGYTRTLNSSAPGKFGWNVIFKQILMMDGWGISCEIALIWMSLDFTDDQSTLVQVMAWCRQATSHYLSQCWPRHLSPYDVTRPQWVTSLKLGQSYIVPVSLKHVWINTDKWTTCMN